MSFVAKQIDHVEVLVRDIDESSHWYADILGLREVARWDPEPVMIATGSTKLALFRADSATRLPATGLYWRRVAFLTDAAGFEQAQEHLRQRGIRFQGPVDHGTAWSIYFEDPDGHPLEITHYGMSAG